MPRTYDIKQGTALVCESRPSFHKGENALVKTFYCGIAHSTPALSEEGITGIHVDPRSVKIYPGSRDLPYTINIEKSRSLAKGTSGMVVAIHLKEGTTCTLDDKRNTIECKPSKE